METKNSDYLYGRIKKEIINKIEIGAFAVGDKLPSESRLMAQYKVGRNTARHALDDLVREGYAKRIQGKGSFVENTKINQPLSGVHSLSELFRSNQRKSYSKIIEFGPVQATQKVRNSLKLEVGEPALRICRLRYADDVPAIINDTFISYNRFKQLLNYDMEIISFYDYLYKKENIYPDTMEEVLDITSLYPDEAKLLQQKPGTPAFMLRGVSHDNTGRPFEVVKSIYRGDMFQFSISLQR